MNSQEYVENLLSRESIQKINEVIKDDFNKNNKNTTKMSTGWTDEEIKAQNDAVSSQKSFKEEHRKAQMNRRADTIENKKKKEGELENIVEVAAMKNPTFPVSLLQEIVSKLNTDIQSYMDKYFDKLEGSAPEMPDYDINLEFRVIEKSRTKHIGRVEKDGEIVEYGHKIKEHYQVGALDLVYTQYYENGTDVLEPVRYNMARAVVGLGGKMANKMNISGWQTQACMSMLRTLIGRGIKMMSDEMFLHTANTVSVVKILKECDYTDKQCVVYKMLKNDAGEDIGVRCLIGNEIVAFVEGDYEYVKNNPNKPSLTLERTLREEEEELNKTEEETEETNEVSQGQEN